MTACVNKKSKRVAAVVTASLVGALSIGAPAVALAANANIETLATAGDEQGLWDLNDVTYNVEKNAAGKYVAKPGSSMGVVSVKDAYGEPVSPSEYTVLYFDTALGTSGKLDASDKLVANTDAVDGNYGGMPYKASEKTYALVLVKGDVTGTLDQNYTYNGLAAKVKSSVLFTIKAETSDIADSFVYEVATEADDFSDTSFTYNGAALDLALSLNGKKLVKDTDYKISLIGAPEDAAGVTDLSGVKEAGSYKFLVTGTGAYTGSKELTVEVSKLDLSASDLVIAPEDKTTGLTITSGMLDLSKVVADGTALKTNAGVQAKLVMIDGETGDFSKKGTSDTQGKTGKYTFLISAKGDTKSVTGSKMVDAYVVDNKVEYFYGSSISALTAASFGTFNPAKGVTFVPGAFTAKADGDIVDYDVKVTKDGKEVTDFTAPGEYVVTLSTHVSADLAYAGSLVTKFTVSGADYSNAVVYATIDGTVLAQGGNAELGYTGEAFVPSVIVKNGDSILAASEYAVEYTDADDKVVDEIVKPGSYKINIKMNDVKKTEFAFNITVGKAQIKSAKAAADFFALPADGSAAVPSFVGSDNTVFDDGVQFDLAANETSVKYYKATWNEGNKTWDKGDAVKASKLTKAGDYLADITVLGTAENVKGSVTQVHFVLADSVVFTDVDANEWYAKPVYEAAKLEYMNGLSGTKLFMPEANITRAELSAVLFNMAGQKATGDKNASFPTKFDDVDKDAWFAETVAWASQAGVMNGYDADSFGPFDNASREQVACILYNYAKAQGKDVSVKDADAALAKYSDGASVSSWAKTAVAWAVENGVMGNGSELNCFGTITRAEVAAMAVNFQPEAL